MLHEEEARVIADSVAVQELAKVVEQQRPTNPTVSLALTDYEVISSPMSRGDREVYDFFYSFEKTDVAFALWSGHGMHFNVVVDVETGATEVVPGE